ncbi:cytochrome P450 [Xylariales sp. PMI_506]|nr:cytochrome P450 [Xylariales sp. PMI_506]
MVSSSWSLFDLSTGEDTGFQSYFFITVIVLFVIYLAGTAIYSLTLHPLSHFPGPVLTSLTRIPFWVACITGHQVQWMHKLHSIYGAVVRYSPNDLSFVDQDFAAWKAIHGHEKGAREFPKAREWFIKPFNGVYGINSAPTHDDHRRFRRVFAPAFSERSLKRQEPIFQKHINLLVETLCNSAVQGQAVNMVEMYQFTTFDIMGHLTFGQPLGLLAGNTYTKWVEAVFDSIKAIPIAQFIQYYSILDMAFKLVEPQFVKDLKYNHFKHSANRVDWRLQRGSEEPDIWNIVLSADSDQQLSLEEMHCHGDVFMLAGSETTGTALSGLTYYLLSNPSKLVNLVNEIRTKFAQEDDINMGSVAELSYLNACIKEALRLYPPVPVGIPRVVPSIASGQIMPGYPVAHGTRVSVHHYATYRSAANFRDPDRFVPERWLGDSAYLGDRRECFQPFAFGPRDCIGQSMAMHEVRLIVAKLLFKFNLEICEESSNWDDQRAFVLWEKKPLMCKLNLAL